MWWKFRVRLSQHRKFWQWRRTFRSAAFLLKRQGFRLTNRLHSVSSAQRIFGGLIRTTLFAFLLALGTATLLQVAEIFVPAPKMAGFYPIPLWHIESNDSYPTLLSTISGIGGVLIALYYSGMVAAGSSVYAKAPGVLRNLLLREPIGKFFIQLVAFTTFLALCLLSFSGMGFSPIRFAFPLLILLSGVAVLSFVHLGQRAFNLFDPTKLAGALFEDLEAAVAGVMAPNRFWNDPSFQSYWNRLADSAIRALGTLTVHAIGEEHLRAEAVAHLAVQTTNFLYDYQSSKCRIPTQSKWYRTQYRHVDFYVADAIKVDLAIRSGSSVQAEISHDERWLEELASDIVLQALKSNLRETSQSEAVSILDCLRVYLERLGRNWQVSAAIDFSLKIAEAVFEAVLEPEPQAHPEEQLIANWQAALLESVALLPIAALLGFAESVHQMSPEKLYAELRRVDWQSPGSPYQMQIEAIALPKIEWFRQRITFELQVVGRRVTPDWFVLQLTSRDYLEALQSCTEALFRGNSFGFQAWASRFERSRNPWGRAILLNRHVEYLSKLSFHLPGIQRLEKSFEKVKVLPDLSGWPKPKGEFFFSSLISAQAAQDQTLAEMALNLSRRIRPISLPDLAGEFLARTANHLAIAVLNPGKGDFEKIFPVFWMASIAKCSVPSDDLESAGRDWFASRVSPLLDLLEISGFAILVSEMEGTQSPRQTPEGLWDTYFRDAKAGTPRIQMVDAALRVAESPMLAPREMQRFQWRTHANDWLREALGLDPAFRAPSWSQSAAAIHPRPLVRVLARDSFLGMLRGSDIFGAMYFHRFLGQTTGSRTRFNGLANSIQLETMRTDTSPEEDDDEPSTTP